jgi:UDP-N-acetylmuramoyl-tripeptide--D-alanyl-D-alanine ligase
MAEAASPAPFVAEEIEQALASVVLEGRATVHRRRDGATIIDDSYNANPESMRAALADLESIAGDRRKIAVLGEMRELGDYALLAHRELGCAIAGAGVALLIGCGGPLVEQMLATAEALGVKALRAASSEEAGKLARMHAICDDVILVKASRGVRAEYVVQALLP